VKLTEYKISTYQSKFAGYHWTTSTSESRITAYISNIWSFAKQQGKSDDEIFDRFVKELNFIIILERICLERGFNKIRMKNRCKPCKMEKYAREMIKEN
jgi:hypothetical protein